MAAKDNRQRQALVDPQGVDRLANAVFTALTTDLGRPFMAGSRNVRSIIREWCPLLQQASDMDVDTFHGCYISAHFFDRYFYSSERSVQQALETQACEKFTKNLGRGYLMNEWRLEFIPFGEFNSVLQSASLEVARILGEFDTEEFFLACNHGPNATLGVRRDKSYLDSKLTSWDGTAEALKLWDDYLEWNSTLDCAYQTYLGPERPVPLIVSGNKLSFVPKKFDSLRTMMVEPTINQFFQQGLGNIIQDRLRRYGGVDISTQPLCHRNLVNVITAHGLEIATLDWSQASDRIWLKLCQRLLPSDWFGALETVRSPCAMYKGKEFRLTMAGSMGCGFTFPLQTLIFLSLLRALARENGCSEFVSVFGDDCICDADLVPHVEWLAQQLDWKLNSDKSFWTGDFRESCGVDSYRGRDCRPFFIERPDDVYSPSALKAWLYSVYNQCRGALGRAHTHTALDAWLVDSFKQYRLGAIQYVPTRFSVTSGVQTSCLSTDLVANTPHSVVERDQMYHFSYNGQRRHTVPVNPGAYYVWALMEKGVPRDFRRAVICPEEDPSVDIDHWNGRVPWKGVAYGTRTTSVHTWHYFIE